MKRAFALAMLAGCGAAQPREAPAPPAPLDEDPLALLPSGLEAVVDLDLGQLRAWPGAAQLLAGLPAPVRGRLASLGFDPLADLDRLAIGARGAGTDGLEVTEVARGRLDPARLRAALATSDGEVAEVDYHGTPIVEGARAAFAQVTPRAVAFGSRAEVRRVIDVAAGNDEGVRLAGEDRALMAALARAPGAKVGRPALSAALRPTPPLAVRLAEAGISTEGVEWVTVAVAVGDGIDVGVVVGARDPARGAALRTRIAERIAELKQQASVRALGFAPFLDVVRMATRREEVHLALRLEQRRFDRLMARLERLVELAGTGEGPRP